MASRVPAAARAAAAARAPAAAAINVSLFFLPVRLPADGAAARTSCRSMHNAWQWLACCLWIVYLNAGRHLGSDTAASSALVTGVCYSGCCLS